MSEIIDMNKTLKENRENKNREKAGGKVKKIVLITVLSVVAFFALLIGAFFIYTGVRSSQYRDTTSALVLTEAEENELQNMLKQEYTPRYEILKSLPYNLARPELNIKAEAAILIDIANGNVLYEKNADKIIPPASMTKLFTMYIVDEEVSSGRFSYDQVIPLPPESWACNMPPHSSLMFLGKDQIVTLEELLLGLSICSGNDAAYAIAYTVCGNMDDFVAKMNQVAAELGLENTCFVESSGYSEENLTTAREMAEFCRVYLKNHPDSLARFHSVESFTYPQEHNMAPGDKYGPQDFKKGYPEHITMGITQKNTNTLLGKLEGCDGLKTGYIDESGYNLALTATRNGTRYLSVTMGGPGKNKNEGNANREKDGTELMEFGFSSFMDMDKPEEIKPYFVKVYGSSQKGVNLVPAFDIEKISVPYVTGDTIADNLSKVKAIVEIPDYLANEVEKGKTYGTVKITLENYVLDEIPLVADRTLEKNTGLAALADSFLISKKAK